jgi:hypothetical protein
MSRSPSAKAPDPCPGSMLRANKALNCFWARGCQAAPPGRGGTSATLSTPAVCGTCSTGHVPRQKELHVPKLSSYTSLRSHSSTCTEHWSIGSSTACPVKTTASPVLSRFFPFFHLLSHLFLFDLFLFLSLSLSLPYPLIPSSSQPFPLSTTTRSK